MDVTFASLVPEVTAQFAGGTFDTANAEHAHTCRTKKKQGYYTFEDLLIICVTIILQAQLLLPCTGDESGR